MECVAIVVEVRAIVLVFAFVFVVVAFVVMARPIVATLIFIVVIVARSRVFVLAFVVTKYSLKNSITIS